MTSSSFAFSNAATNQVAALSQLKVVVLGVSLAQRKENRQWLAWDDGSVESHVDSL
jgi:hypothetical protein